MKNFKKILLKGYSNKAGLVQYCAEVNNCNVLISDVNELFKLIKKDFPKIAENQVDITIEGKQLNLTFFTFNLPNPNRHIRFFDEEHYVDEF